MFKEATKFANHLRQVETDLKAWQREIEGENHHPYNMPYSRVSRNTR
jgi:hypothetical protein